jgi:hypothetical protein
MKLSDPLVKCPILGPEIVTILWRKEMRIPGYTNRQTPWSWVRSEKLIVACLVKKFSAFSGTRKFIIVFTRALHFSLSRARWIQSTTSILMIQDTLFKIIIPPFKWSPAFGFPHQNSVCVTPLPPSKLHVPLVSFALIWWPEVGFVRGSDHDAACYAVRSTALLTVVCCKHRALRTQTALVRGFGSRFIWVISFTP